jgi:hypothetical protein
VCVCVCVCVCVRVCVCGWLAPQVYIRTRLICFRKCCALCLGCCAREWESKRGWCDHPLTAWKDDHFVCSRVFHFDAVQVPVRILPTAGIVLDPHLLKLAQVDRFDLEHVFVATLKLVAMRLGFDQRAFATGCHTAVTTARESHKHVGVGARRKNVGRDGRYLVRHEIARLVRVCCVRLHSALAKSDVFGTRHHSLPARKLPRGSQAPLGDFDVPFVNGVCVGGGGGGLRQKVSRIRRGTNRRNGKSPEYTRAFSAITHTTHCPSTCSQPVTHPHKPSCTTYSRSHAPPAPSS